MSTKKGRKVEIQGLGIVAHLAPASGTLEKHRATLTKYGAECWDLGFHGRNEIRDELLRMTGNQAVIVAYRGRDVSLVYGRVGGGGS